ncbi:hypothetical protein C4579_02805 [Candidatus Microgenomates bacterium]|nr:MAG: hypothetical protein C4579_02805 [Candidatus Microgenomates bacterium]
MNKKVRRFLPKLPQVTFSKRQQFVAVTIVLTILMMATQTFTGQIRFDIMGGLMLVTFILSAFVLREDLKGWEFVTLLILPTFYTAAVFLIYFLLPTRWLTRLPIAVLYAIGMYAILLTENIYNVAAERTIQLIRAAHSVGFLLSLVTIFFLTDTFLSLRLPFYFNLLLGFFIAFPLTFQALWSMELTEKISHMVWVSSLIISLIITEIFFIFSFWPVGSTIEALFVTTVFYSLVGMAQQYLIGRLFVKTSREFILVLVVVFFIIIFTTRWGGGF